MTKEKALTMANEEATRLEYDISSMDIEIEKYNTPWNKYLPKDNDSEYVVDMKNKLANKEYWAIYYAPKEMQFGGDICIFIDSKTGKILATMRGK